MGDVALLVPVVNSLVAFNKDVEVTVVTRPRFAVFFSGVERVRVFPADVDHRRIAAALEISMNALRLRTLRLRSRLEECLTSCLERE